MNMLGVEGPSLDATDEMVRLAIRDRPHNPHSRAGPSSLPSQPTWYHGDLSAEAASRLLEGRPGGSFLVYRVDGRRGDYTLACVDADCNVHRTPIRQLASAASPSLGSPVLFAWGRQFASLAALVGWWLGERNASGEPSIEVPVEGATTSAAQDADEPRREKRIVLQDYRGDTGGPAEHHLSVSVGDLVSVLRACGGDWVWARKEGAGREGFLPLRITQPLVRESPRSLVDLPYYHAGRTQHEYCRMLTDGGIGSFLVRPCSSLVESVLLVHTGSRVEKFKLRRVSVDGVECVQLENDARTFPAVEHVIERYCDRPIVLGVRLVRGVIGGAGEEQPEQQGEDECDGGGWRRAIPPAPIRDKSHHQQGQQAHEAQQGCVVAAGPAMRKTKEEKPWKKCHLQLTDNNDGICELVVADEEGGKPRHVFDLAYVAMYCIDDTMYHCDGCMFLSPSDSDSQGVYLWLRPSETYIEWIRVLRARCENLRRAQMARAALGSRFEPPRISQMAVIYILIDKFKAEWLKLDGRYSVCASLNGVRVVSTPVRQLSNLRGGSFSVVLDTTSIMSFAPVGSGQLQLSIFAHSTSSTSLLSSISMSSLAGTSNNQSVRASGGCFNSGKCLLVSPCYTVGDEPLNVVEGGGGFTFSLSKTRVRVLPLDAYDTLRDEMSVSRWSVCEWAGGRLSPEQTRHLCSALVAAFMPKPEEWADMLRCVVRRMLECSEGDSLFRQDSFCTTLLTAALRLACRNEVEEEFDPIVAGCRRSGNVTGADVAAVMGSLQRTARLRPPVRKVLLLLASEGRKRFPKQPHLVRRLLSAVYILRFANPYLVVQGATGQQLAKLVQSTANTACAEAYQRDAEESSAARLLYETFDRIILDADADEAPRRTDASLCPAHLALVCHHLSLAVAADVPAPSVDQAGPVDESAPPAPSRPAPPSQTLLRLLHNHVVQ